MLANENASVAHDTAQPLIFLEGLPRSWVDDDGLRIHRVVVDDFEHDLCDRPNISFPCNRGSAYQGREIAHLLICDCGLSTIGAYVECVRRVVAQPGFVVVQEDPAHVEV